MRRLTCLIPVIMLVVLPAIVTAGGFNIYEMGGRATALGGAFTATADDPSAIFYNPAGIAFLDEGWSASLNIAPVMPKNKLAVAEGLTSEQFPGDPTAETKDALFLPTGAYVTYRHSDAWSMGLGFFTPFGLGIEWEDPETFAGRSEATNSHIQGLYFSPVVTYSPRSDFALSAGVNIVKTTLTLERIVTQRFGTDNAVYNVMDVEMEGTSNWTASASAALLWKATDKLNLGVNYKGGITNKFEEDDASFTQIETGEAALDASVALTADTLDATDVSGELEYPSIVAMGGRYQATEKLALMADFVWFNWSVFENVNLVFESDDFIMESELREDYTDGQQWRFGSEYQITPALHGMIGFVHDNSPQPVGSVSPILPDSDRLDYSLGLTYTSSQFELTAAYMLVTFETRSTVEDGVGQNYDGFDGTYDAVVHIPAIGVTYNF